MKLIVATLVFALLAGVLANESDDESAGLTDQDFEQLQDSLSDDEIAKRFKLKKFFKKAWKYGWKYGPTAVKLAGLAG